MSVQQQGGQISVISIHALRAEGDPVRAVYPAIPDGISIHALRAEGDTRATRRSISISRFLSTPSVRRATRYSLSISCAQNKFLSTPSVRRATGRSDGGRPPFGYFYPRPPCGGRRLTFHHAGAEIRISIHALRAEGDPLPQSRGSLDTAISIHALRAEGDPCIMSGIQVS